MGILAITRTSSDALILDIGGTTTDVAIFAGGQPLLEREGISIEGRPTLVRAMHVESIGIGGDSLLQVEQDQVLVGPKRIGPCMARGGFSPTLMDAFNVLKLAAFGDEQRSAEGVEALAVAHGMTGMQLAAKAMDVAINAISAKIEDLIALVNSRPVYTIHEILEDRPIFPTRLIMIGGPAAVFKELLQTRLGMEVVVPPLYEVANAIGAALTRSTSYLDLTADTVKGMLSVPRLAIYRSVPRNYDLEAATSEARSLLIDDLEQAGVSISADEVQITQADSFNVVEDFYTAGRNIRVVSQVQPAVIAHIDTGNTGIRVNSRP